MRNPFTLQEWSQVLTGGAGLLILINGILMKLRREERIKAQWERIKGNGKCEGAAEVPEGAEKLLSTDETDGMVKQGQVWLKDRNFYISRSLLASDSEMLTAYFGTPYLRVSLDDVEDCKITQWTIELGLPSVPCLVTLYHDFSDKPLQGRDRFFAALKKSLKCRVEEEKPKG